MPEIKDLQFEIRNVKLEDITQVYRLLTANRPYVGLNSRYTYFLLAKDFSNTCVVAEHEGKIVGFSSGYVPPTRQDVFFNWETVVQSDYRGYGLQRSMILYQIKLTNVKYLEATINPSNAISKRTLYALVKLLNTQCVEETLFNEEDFENDGHEAEVLYRAGPISPEVLKTVKIFKKGLN